MLLLQTICSSGPTFFQKRKIISSQANFTISKVLMVWRYFFSIHKTQCGAVDGHTPTPRVSGKTYGQSVFTSTAVGEHNRLHLPLTVNFIKDHKIRKNIFCNPRALAAVLASPQNAEHDAAAGQYSIQSTPWRQQLCPQQSQSAEVIQQNMKHFPWPWLFAPGPLQPASQACERDAPSICEPSTLPLPFNSLSLSTILGCHICATIWFA